VEELVAWLDGEMPLLRRIRTDRHVRDCEACLGRIAELEHALQSARQEALAAAPADRVEIDRARWEFRERVDEIESSQAGHRLRAPIWAGAALVAGVVLAALLQRTPAPLNPPVQSEALTLATLETAETAGFESAVREDRFTVEIGSERREWRVWSAPRSGAYAVRGSDSSGTLRLELVYTRDRGLRPSRQALYHVVAHASADPDAIEAAFWKWVRAQAWRPVSLAREMAEFSSGGAILQVVRERGMIFWKAQRGEMQATLAAHDDGQPRWLELSWGEGVERRVLRVSRQGRRDYADFVSAAAYFIPE
jgi:hypothetical protein